MVREILLKTLRYYCTRPRGRAIEQHSLSLIALIIVDVLAFIASRLLLLSSIDSLYSHTHHSTHTPTRPASICERAPYLIAPHPDGATFVILRRTEDREEGGSRAQEGREVGGFGRKIVVVEAKPAKK